MGAIVEVYRKTRKQPDLFWNRYVCRPVAAVVVWAVSYWGLLIGVIVFELSYVLDCADGMLARLRGSQSPAGHLLDFLMDEVKAFVMLGVVTVRQLARG